MRTVDIVEIIGNTLTQLDMMLADPNLSSSDPNFQQLMALRKHLDDLQRALVAADIDDSTAQFAQAAAQLKASDEDLKKIGANLTKIASVIGIAAKVASFADQLIGLVK